MPSSHFLKGYHPLLKIFQIHLGHLVTCGTHMSQTYKIQDRDVISQILFVTLGNQNGKLTFQGSFSNLESIDQYSGN